MLIMSTCHIRSLEPMAPIEVSQLNYQTLNVNFTNTDRHILYLTNLTVFYYQPVVNLDYWSLVLELG